MVKIQIIIAIIKEKIIFIIIQIIMEIKIITTEIMLMVIVMEMDKIDLTIETIKMVKDKTLTNHKGL